MEYCDLGSLDAAISDGRFEDYVSLSASLSPHSKISALPLHLLCTLGFVSSGSHRSSYIQRLRESSPIK
jgi:hypothetical protein